MSVALRLTGEAARAFEEMHYHTAGQAWLVDLGKAPCFVCGKQGRRPE